MEESLIGRIDVLTRYGRRTAARTGAARCWRSSAGGYAQPGRFTDELLKGWSPDARDEASGTQTEWTADYSWLDFDDPLAGESGNRLRLQWELSL